MKILATLKKTNEIKYYSQNYKEYLYTTLTKILHFV